MALKATEVFTPGAFPSHTYVERKSDRLEQALQDALATPGQLVSVSGPSKSGKTVLVEKVVGPDNLITITGAGIQQPNDLWDRVLDWMDAPTTRKSGAKTGGQVAVKAEVQGSAGLPFIGEIEGKVDGGAQLQHDRSNEKSFERTGMKQVVDEIANSDFVLLIDDFHYMPRLVQEDAAKIIKEAIRLGVKVCAAAVRHRGDDVVRANPELRGRVRAIDLNYWAAAELKQIARTGFDALKVDFPEEAIDRFVVEAAGSPQLMQSICLNACFVTGARERGLTRKSITCSDADIKTIFEQTTTSTDFRSLVDVLDAGPKTRGTERRLYDFKDGTKGDVYRCILKAVSSDPPRLAHDYDEITRRVRRICASDMPVGSSVIGTCLHMSKLAQEKFPNERAIDWDEQKQILDIPDPYLLFYLRWSERLNEDPGP
ncbi:MAG TPA: hypothetical protein VHP37_06940 [Burkholderiales bacterium]|nr:hypothetical protein [Burkholderiales bacterium]